MKTTEKTGKRKIDNHEKPAPINEGFRGENLPENYDPSSAKQETEVEKDKHGNKHVVKRSRDVEENEAKNVDSTSGTAKDSGKSKSRGTTSEKENVKTAENRDFNSDTDEKKQLKRP